VGRDRRSLAIHRPRLCRVSGDAGVSLGRCLTLGLAIELDDERVCSETWTVTVCPARMRPSATVWQQTQIVPVALTRRWTVTGSVRGRGGGPAGRAPRSRRACWGMSGLGRALSSSRVVKEQQRRGLDADRDAAAAEDLGGEDRCLTTDNATNANPGLPPKSERADHGQRRQASPDTHMSSISRDRTHRPAYASERFLYVLKGGGAARRRRPGRSGGAGRRRPARPRARVTSCASSS
jgi:hypothetical protein